MICFQLALKAINESTNDKDQSRQSTPTILDSKKEGTCHKKDQKNSWSLKKPLVTIRFERLSLKNSRSSYIEISPESLKQPKKWAEKCPK